MAYAHVPDNQRTKLDKKAEKMRFVGYSIQPRGYRLMNEKTHKVVIRRDVAFNEGDFDRSHSETPEEPLVVEINNHDHTRSNKKLLNDMKVQNYVSIPSGLGGNRSGLA